jgi:hypothetical protein
MYSELIRINEISAAEYIACMISDVESEIKYSESKIIELNSLGYDLTYIYSEQEHISHKYRKKIGR